MTVIASLANTQERPHPPAQPVAAAVRDVASREDSPARNLGAPHAPAPAPAARALLPAKLVIELDTGAERYVQTLVADEAVLRRFPSENQLAFSRGIVAYTRAVRAASQFS